MNKQINLSHRKTCGFKVEIKIHFAENFKVFPEKFIVPCSLLCEAVVGNHEGAKLSFRKMIDADRGDFSVTQRFGGLDSAVSSNDTPFRINQNWCNKSEAFNASRKLFQLPPAVNTGIEKLFVSSSGSAVRGFYKFRANIPPRWIKNARNSRKRIEPEIVEALRSVKSIRQNRPRAQVALKTANKEFKAVLKRWETAYSKENFYRGIRILLELQRNGSSAL